MTEQKPIKVAVIGGGCAAISAAFELSRPAHKGKYQVTIYQLGWRLGGKGASGRGPANRIEEHGLHLWMGSYENAFRLIRECATQSYDGIGANAESRTGETHSLQRLSSAWPSDHKTAPIGTSYRTFRQAMVFREILLAKTILLPSLLISHARLASCGRCSWRCKRVEAAGVRPKRAAIPPRRDPPISLARKAPKARTNPPNASRGSWG